VILDSIIRLLRSWGVDKAIAYSLISRGWTAIAGPVSVVLIATRLSPTEQGFFYTFGSILGLQVFFEMGMSNVILQFASHEKAKLEWTPEGTLEGDAVAKARLASLLHSSLVWYVIIAVLVAAVLLPTGYVFFSKGEGAKTVAWQYPWALIVLAAAANLFINPMYALVEGCGLVAKMASVRMYQNIGGQLLLWIALLLGLGLFAAPALSLFALLVGSCWLWMTRRTLLSDLFALSGKGAGIDWRREVWPFQWRIALSWLSGYFIFQLFNPFMFAFHGAVAAGRMGMSLSIMAALSTAAVAWVGTKAAPFGSLIARGEYDALDQQFFRSLRQSTILIVLAGLGFWATAFYLHSMNYVLGQRLLPPLPLFLLILSAIINHVVTAEAIYLRAHKQEPFLWISVVSGCLVGFSSYFLGKQYGATGMMLGYLTVTSVVGLGAGTWIFINKRQLWHSERKPDPSFVN
jgi:O-antigen/teichoic acid export membrane protein